MRVALLLLALGGCGRTNPTETTNPIPDPKADRERDFNAKSFPDTCGWVAARVRRLERVQRGDNDLASQKALTDINAELAKRIGEKVSWEVVVERVVRGQVVLKQLSLGDAWNAVTKKPWPVTTFVTATPGADLPGPRDPGYADVVFGAVPIGKCISEEAAAKLRAGDKLTLTGVVRQLNLDGDAAHLQCRIVIGNAVSPP